MSIANQLERVQALKARLRTKLVALLSIDSAATLEQCVEAVESILDNGGISATLDTAATSYTVPAGIHDGTGKVQIVPEHKSVTPTKATQEITPGAGKVLSGVSVGAIPANYADVSSVDATADKVLSGIKFVDADGALKAGTMPDNGAVAASFDGINAESYTIPKGYHSGAGTVSLDGTIEAELAAL